MTFKWASLVWPFPMSSRLNRVNSLPSICTLISDRDLKLNTGQDKTVESSHYSSLQNPPSHKYFKSQLMTERPWKVHNCIPWKRNRILFEVLFRIPVVNLWIDSESLWKCCGKRASTCNAGTGFLSYMHVPDSYTQRCLVTVSQQAVRRRLGIKTWAHFLR